MTPLEMLIGEINDAAAIKFMILDNISRKNNKKMRFNVTNIIFNFKSNIVEIQGEIGVADQRIQRMTIDELVRRLD